VSARGIARDRGWWRREIFILTGGPGLSVAVRWGSVEAGPLVIDCFMCKWIICNLV
jgi:hypothetical protein